MPLPSESVTSVVSISPTSSSAAENHLTIADFTFEIQTSFDYVRILPPVGGNMEFATGQNIHISIPVKSLSRPVDDIVLTFADSSYFLSLSPNLIVYETIIKTPPAKRSNRLSIVVKYGDGTMEELHADVSIDPYGYIYENVRDQDLHLAGATVTLEECSGADASGCRPAALQKQLNPQTTNRTGEYYFLVQPGTYRLIAKKPRYTTQTIAFTATTSLVTVDIELKPEGSPVATLSSSRNWLLLVLLAVLLFVFIVTIFVLWRRKHAQHEEYQRVDGGEPAENGEIPKELKP
jgi:hypothetical protein